jgi:glycosyltransferase involved in cell wall biosynthesis
MSYRTTLVRLVPGWVLRVKRNCPVSVAWLSKRLWNGFSASALAALRDRSLDASTSVWTRARARRAITRWEHRPHVAPVDTAPVQVDVLIVSSFSFAGGTTSSNVQEIQAQVRAGLRTGLIDHPVWDWQVPRPVDSRIRDLVDGSAVQWISPGQHVAADLAIIRAPKAIEHLMDDLPRISAKRTVVVVNQTPRYHYGDGASAESAYDLAACVANVKSAFGEATWYPIGPRVRDALVTHHPELLPGTALADTDWVNIIDPDAWVRSGERAADGTVRIGRHSRDDPTKWLQDADALRAAYPSAEPFEVHVLGGARSAKRVLGSVPERWRVSRFGALSPREFLHGLDVYVYFTAASYTEAFGRAPLEALAVGLPTILPREFEPLFGDAALYGGPQDVRGIVDALMGDPRAYQAQADRARQYVASHFSYDTHVARLAALGVGLAPKP